MIKQIPEVLRRLYYDLGIRRSTVRIHTPSEIKLSYSPIFVIGVYRSGTTLVRYILDSHSQISCPPESDFIGPLSHLVEKEMYRRGLQTMGYDEEHVLQKLRELVLYFFGNYVASTQKARWADKSPSYVDYLDFLLQLFPNAQFIMIYRNGFDQAHSFTRGGTYMRDALQEYVHDQEDLRIGAVRYWAEKVEKMLLFESQHRAQCHHIRYEDICAAPEALLQPLFHFLGEKWEPQVLEFYKFSHDKGAEDGRAIATKGFVSSGNHFKEWPANLLNECKTIAQPALIKLDYISECKQ